MRRFAVGIGVGLVATALLAGPAELLAQGKKLSREEAALQKNAEAFVAAFNKGDARALADFWTPEGDYIDQEGQRLKGRKAIEEAMRGFFAENKGAKLRINIDSVRVVNPE